MANRKGRGRSRKRRSSASRRGAAQSGNAVGGQTSTAPRERPTRAKANQESASSDRPQSLWHPLPLSEVLILVGMIGMVIGLRKISHDGALSHGDAPLFAGIVALSLGSGEVALREHSSGYRSHTMFLSFAPAVLFHSLFVLIFSLFANLGRTVNLALLPVDFALFLFMFRLMRMRYIDARRSRAFPGNRRLTRR